MRAVLSVCAIVTLSAIATPASASADPLDGGLSVVIESPAAGSLLPAGPVTVSGTAAVGEGVPDTALVLLLDVSGSADNPGVAGCGGDQNGDGRANRMLDCEVAAARALTAHVAGLGVVASVGVVVLADDAAVADVGPAPGVQQVTGPDTDADGTGGRDVDQVLASAFAQFGGAGGIGLFTARTVGTATDFADGIRAVAAASGRARTVVAFLSDGPATVGDSTAGPLADLPAGVDIVTFALGTLACTNASAGRGSLLGIATATGGTCTRVATASTLPAVLTSVVSAALPAVEPPTLAALTLTVDGGTPAPVTAVTPPLPVTGPATVAWTTTADLAPGPHELCVTATGGTAAIEGIGDVGDITATGGPSGAGDTSGAGGIGGTSSAGGTTTDCTTVVAYLTGRAFAVAATGPVTVQPSPLAACPPDGNHVQLGLGTPVATLAALRASCTVGVGTGVTTATASVEGASLLGGLITLTAIESTCVSGAAGVSRTSSVGTLNGLPIGSAPTSLGVPGVAQVFLNESTTVDGTPARNAVRVRTLLGQDIVLAGCRLG